VASRSRRGRRRRRKRRTRRRRRRRKEGGSKAARMRGRTDGGHEAEGVLVSKRTPGQSKRWV
jgi:hypothetical protein